MVLFCKILPRRHTHTCTHTLAHTDRYTHTMHTHVHACIHTHTHTHTLNTHALNRKDAKVFTGIFMCVSEHLHSLKRACFEYFKFGGQCVDGPIGLLSV